MAAMFVPHCDEVYGDPGVHAKSVTYFENLRNMSAAHEMSMMMMTSGPLDDRAKIVCLGIIEDYIRTSYQEVATLENRQVVRNFLNRYANTHLPDRRIMRQEDPQILSLAAEIFGLVALIDYPLHWPGFFTKLVSIAGLGSRGVDHFLLTLRVISHNIIGLSETFDNNWAFVRALQAKDFEGILDTWYWILVEGEESIKTEIMSLINEYMTLIDPEYFSRHRIMNHLLEELENVNLQKNALNCFYELILRMDVDKEEHRDSVVIIFQQLVSRNLVRADHVNEKFSARMGTLIGIIGIKLLQVSTANDCSTVYYSNLNAFLPYIFNFMDSRTFSISSSVVTFFLFYTKFLKERKKLSREEYNNFIKLLGIVMVRIKMRPTYVYREDYLDMKQDAFIKYRITLMNLFDNIATVKRKVVFKGISQLILKNLVKKDWRNEEFNVAEYPVFLIHFLSKSYWQLEWQNHTVKPSKALLMRALLNSDIVVHPHPAVTEQFFKAIGHNVNFFQAEPKFIPYTLTAFLKRGLNNSSQRVQHTCADQMLKFIKSLSSHLSDSYLDIITCVKDAAVIPASFIDGPRSSVLRPGTRLSLFETYGIAICQGKFHKQNKRHFLAEFLVPTMHMYHDSCNEWSTSRDQDVCAERICRAMDVVSCIARAFDPVSASTSGCDDVFIDTITILDHCPMSQLVRSDIHLATTHLIRQMVVSLDEKFIPFLPKMLQGMLCCKAHENIYHITQLLIFIINKYKRHVLRYFKSEFVRICFHIYDPFTILAKQNPAEKQRRLNERQELFLPFLKALADNLMLVEIFTNHDEKTVKKLVTMIVTSALEGSRGPCRAQGIAILAHIVDKWAHPNETHSQALVTYVCMYMVRTCFVAMRDAIDNLDGSFLNYLDIFTESANLINTMYRRNREELISWLVLDYLPKSNVPSAVAEEFVAVVVGDASITLEDYLKSFFFEVEDICIPPLNPFIPTAITHHIQALPYSHGI